MKKFGLLVLSTAAVVMFVGDLSAMQNQGWTFKPRTREQSLEHARLRAERQAAARSTPVQQVKINQLEQKVKKNEEKRNDDIEKIKELQKEREKQENRIKILENELITLRLQQKENTELSKEKEIEYKNQIENLQTEIEKIKKSNYFRDVTADSSSNANTTN